MSSRGPFWFFRSAAVCCPRTDSALTRKPFATQETCQPTEFSVALLIVTFWPGLSTDDSGGRMPLTSFAVDVGIVVVEGVVAEVVGVDACVAVVDEEECESPQPAAARTHTTARAETRQFDNGRFTPNREARTRRRRHCPPASCRPSRRG
jgi:hypothetical protein